MTEGGRRGLCVSHHFSPFTQIEIQALTPTSALYQPEPNVIVVALRLEDIAPTLVWSYARLSVTQVGTECARVEDRLSIMLTRIRQGSRATV